jgi:drug/metabolite transporter (DMT)-like permease
VSLICTFYPLTRLPVADVLTLTNMFPIWVALLSWPVLGAPPTLEVWLAVASGIAGVILMLQPHGGEGNFAAFVALFASFTTAISMIGLHWLRHIDSRAIVFHFSLVAMVFCIGSAFVFERQVATEQILVGWTPLLLVGVGVMAATGQIFLTKAFASGPPAKVSVVGLMQIPFAMVLDILLWNRRFEPVTLLGMLLIVAPTARLITRRR